MSLAKADMTAEVNIWWRSVSSSDPESGHDETRYVYAGFTPGDRFSFIGPGLGQTLAVSAVAVSPNGAVAALGTRLQPEPTLGRSLRPSSAAAPHGFCVMPPGEDVLLVAPVNPDRDVDE